MSWTIVEQSETGNTKYIIAEFGVLEDGLKTGTNELRTSITTPVSSLGNNITVIGISATTTTGSGSGAIFTLISSGGGIISMTAGTITVTVPGSGYAATDVITFSQSDLINAGFDGANEDLVITLAGGDIEPLVASTPNLNIAGYTRGTVIATTTTGHLEIRGSNDGINFFQLDFISPNPVTSFGPTAEPIIWNYALRNIRFTTSTASFSSIYLMGIAGGGNDVTDITQNVSGTAALPVKSLQYNDGGIWGGTGTTPADTAGVRYEKTANANSGQLQLDSGTVALPILSFADSSGDFNNGIYKVAVDQIGMTAGGGVSNAGEPIAVVANEPSDPIYSVGFNVVNTSGNDFGLRRIATTTGGIQGDASWEDGFFGNSEEMFFTCNDFSFVDAATGNTPITCGCGSGLGPVRGTFLGPVLVLPAGGLVPSGRIIACKLIPKGFYIPSGTPLTIQINNDGGTLFGSTTCTAEVYSYVITTPITTPVLRVAATPLLSLWTDGTNTQTTISANIIGDGTTLVFISILIPAGTPSTSTIALEEGLSFASLKISRLPV